MSLCVRSAPPEELCCVWGGKFVESACCAACDERFIEAVSSKERAVGSCMCTNVNEG